MHTPSVWTAGYNYVGTWEWLGIKREKFLLGDWDISQNEPNGDYKKNQFCLYIGEASKGTWFDGDCTSEHSFVCESSIPMY